MFARIDFNIYLFLGMIKNNFEFILTEFYFSYRICKFFGLLDNFA